MAQAITFNVCAAALFILSLVSGSLQGQPMGGASYATLVASPESGWPQFRGSRRDGICDETGLLQQWPEGGPKLVWKMAGIGKGYSCPIIVSNRIFITGDMEKQFVLFGLDMEGKILWRSTNGQSWTGAYPGARACFTYRAGRLFNLNAHGRVAAFEGVSGKELWSVDLLERFGGRVNTWAYSECLLVDGTNVIVTPGGTKALMAALSAQTGQTVWQSAPMLREDEGEGAESASYAPPILIQVGNKRQIAGCSLRHLFAVNAENGQRLWARGLRTRYSVIASSPVLVGDGIFATAPDSEDGKLYRVEKGGELRELWTTELDTCHGGVIYLPQQKALYGAWYRNHKGWSCIDAGTGKVRYGTDALAKGSALYADGRLYILSEEGDMALVEPAATEFKIVSRFRLVPGKKSDAWAHPVILGRKLYLRYHDELFCYDIGR